MRRHTRFLEVTLIFCTLAAGVGAQSATQNHARIQLVSDESTFKPGQLIWVGVSFQMDPVWHIYWRNPGDSGLPPTVQWTMPSGFHAGELRWPRPSRLDHGSVVDYGYEDQLLLMAPVKTSVNATGVVKITADVKYLICREICIPAKAQVSFSLPSSADSAQHFSGSHTLFESARGQFPKTAPGTWQISAESNQRKNTFEIVVRGLKTKKAIFFPLDPGIVDNVAPQSLSPVDGGTAITIEQSELLTKPVRVLRGLLDVPGMGTFEIAAPVTGR